MTPLRKKTKRRWSNRWRGSSKASGRSWRPLSVDLCLHDYLRKVELKPWKDRKRHMLQFIQRKSKPILNHLPKESKQKIEGLIWYISVKIRFVKPKPDGEDLITETRFQSQFMTTVMVTKLKVNNKKPSKKSSNCYLSIRKMEVTGRWIKYFILTLSMVQYTLLKGSGYISLPWKLRNKKPQLPIRILTISV